MSEISDEDSENLELWQATLPATIWTSEEELIEFRVWLPKAEPRPEIRRLKSPNKDDYNFIVLSTRIQNEPGEISPTNFPIAADHAL